MPGGTMGVVYGAAGLWQWKITRDEAGCETWTDQPLSWSEAAEMEGARYVGLVGTLLKGLDLTDIERRGNSREGSLSWRRRACSTSPTSPKAARSRSRAFRRA
jgi:hypothetical protein